MSTVSGTFQLTVFENGMPPCDWKRDSVPYTGEDENRDNKMVAIEAKKITIEMQIAQIPIKNVAYAESCSVPKTNAMVVGGVVVSIEACVACAYWDAITPP